MEQVLPLTKVDKMRFLILLLLATPVYSQSILVSPIVSSAGSVSTSSSNSVYIDQIGNNNTTYIDQNGSTNKSITILNGGNNNTISIFQQDSGNQQAFIGTVPDKPGPVNNNQFVFPNTNNNNNNNTLSIVQTGSGNHIAAINLDPTTSNSNNTASIMQSGTANKSFNLNLSGSGIGASIVQDNPTVPDSASMSIQCLTPPCNGYSYIKH